MAQVLTTKQGNWVFRFSQQVVALMAAADALTALTTEMSNDSYGSGGTNALTDAVVQASLPNGPLPAATAALVFSAAGSLANSNAILATIAANRQSLEWMRP